MSYFKVNKINAIDSTNLALKRKYQKGLAEHGEVLWALDQYKGKGQRESQWVCEPNKNLTFSIFLTQNNLTIPSVFALSCWVALAVKSTLDSLNIPTVSIKWPNDILSEEHKICGLLVENLYRGTAHTASIVGIGINVNQINFPGLNNASSMQLCSGQSFSLEMVLHLILDNFRKYLELPMSLDESFDAFNQALFGRGKQRNFIEDGQIFSATVERVTSHGELVLKTADNQLRNFQHKTIEWVY